MDRQANKDGARVIPVLTAGLLLTAAGCGGGASAGDGAAAAELPGSSVTLWTDSTELFMEHPALLPGRPGKFAVHLTDLTDFAPLTSGRMVLRFEPAGGGEGFSVVQEAPSRPGIYGPSPEFPRAGVWNLTIEVESPQARDRIVVPGLRVHATEADVPAEDDAGGGIAFLKEQQWKTPGFRTEFARDGMVQESFEATGTVVPAAGRLAEVAAPIAGLVEAAGVTDAPVPGQRVAAGQVLLVLTPSLGEAGSTYAEARGELREAEAEHARAERLYAVEAIPERRLREAASRLQVAREALAGLTGGGTPRSDGRLAVRSPIAGVVTSRSVSAGSRVAAGDRLFTVVDAGTVWVQANVPAAEAARIGAASGASFQLEGSPRIFEAPRTIAVGSVLDSLSRTVPVIYQAANPDGAIKIGANARVAIRTGRRAAGVVIPASAVLDEDGRSIVYVQLDGESFEKRVVTIGGREGERTLVVGGLTAGDRAVTGAAYQVRLASLSTSAPAHGHEH